MHLIAIRNLRRDAAKYPDLTPIIELWYRVVKAARWQNLEDVRQIFASAEAVVVGWAMPTTNPFSKINFYIAQGIKAVVGCVRYS